MRSHKSSERRDTVTTKKNASSRSKLDILSKDLDGDGNSFVVRISDGSGNETAPAPTDVDGHTYTFTVVAPPTAAPDTVKLANGTAVSVGQVLTTSHVAGLQYDTLADADGASGQFAHSVYDGQETQRYSAPPQARRSLEPLS